MADTEHQINAQLIERFKPFYDNHPHALIEHIVHFIKSPFGHHGHHAVVDTSNYTHKNIGEFSESQIVDRTVFALKKIMVFNHHYFPPTESRILSPYPSGFLHRSVVLGSCAVNAIVATYMFKNRYFSLNSLMFFGALLAGEYVLARIPNVWNNYVQGFSRRKLARKYIDYYGAQYFHDIIDPRFDVEKLRHLENGLHQ